MNKEELISLLEAHNCDGSVCSFISIGTRTRYDCEKVERLAKLLLIRGDKIVFRLEKKKGVSDCFISGVEAEWRLQLIVEDHNYYHHYNRPDEGCPVEKHLLKKIGPFFPARLDGSDYHILKNYLHALDIPVVPIAGDDKERYRAMILGLRELKPASLVILNGRSEDDRKGKLDFCRKICEENNIRFIEQEQWMALIDDE